MTVRFAERALLVFGFTCLGWYGLAAADAAYTQQELRVAIERAIETAESAVPDNKAPVADATTGTSLIGLLEIPRLGVSTPVVEGDDATALHGTAGHLPDTPRPWERGNSAIAAHRDGLFRPLRHIRVGDELRVHTPHGELIYEVKDTHIVRPSDLSVLEAKAEHMLTLITCYPFYYVGSAPKRFIVHAERVTPRPGSGQAPRLGSGQAERATARAREPQRQRPRRTVRTAVAGRTRVAEAAGSKPSATSPPQRRSTKSTRAESPAPSKGKPAARR